MKKVTNYETISLLFLSTDLGTQSRCLQSPAKKADYEKSIKRYAHEMIAGTWRWEESPPIVFGPFNYLGRRIYCPGDGHARILAAAAAGYESIFCQLNPGSAVDALRYSLGPANRNYAHHKLDAQDIGYRVHLALQERDMWRWVDRRVLDYCDDGNRLIKLRKVDTLRRKLLAHWQSNDVAEYSWRIKQLEEPGGLLDIDSTGQEFTASRPSKQPKQHSTRVSSFDLSKLAYQTAQIRSAQAGCGIQEWIENAILLADKLVTLPTETSQTRYLYTGGKGVYPVYDAYGNETDLRVPLLPSQSVYLVDVPTDDDSDSLPVRLAGSLWNAGFHLRVKLSLLDWQADSA